MKALILAGGSGTRFWPLSRRRRPKQLLCLDGDRSLLQRTVDRLEGLLDPSDVWVITTVALAEAIREQLPEVPAAQILAEPEGRNTAPAIAWAVAAIPEDERGETMVVLPADHRVEDRVAFREAVEEAGRLARRDGLVMTLGVQPHRAETGYGYLEVGKKMRDSPQASEVVRFTEKPQLDQAREFLASGKYLWNAGIFVFTGTVLLEGIAEHLPALHHCLEEWWRHPDQLERIYGSMPKISIDHGLMEKLSKLGTIPLGCGWSDLGSWQALTEIMERTGDNQVHGDVVAVDAQNNLLWSEEGLIAVVGISGLVVVRTGDTVLVMPVERAQEVKTVVNRLQARGRDQHL